MRGFFSILAGSPIFYFIVFKPMQAMLVASLAMNSHLDAVNTVKMLSQSYIINPRNNKILVLCGDIASANALLPNALWAYGEAMKNSPANAEVRYRYGSVLFAMNYDGSFAYREALKLEPHNIGYIHQVENITTFQSLLR